MSIKKLKKMSPFEIRNELKEAANISFQKHKKLDSGIFNDGRNNPNFLLNTTTRKLKDTAKVSFQKNKKSGSRILNAGRGNPNFLNTTTRKAFGYLTLFASTLAEESSKLPDIGFSPKRENIYNKLLTYLTSFSDKGAILLKTAVEYAVKDFKIDKDAFVYELVDSALGDYYPLPPRMMPYIEQITRRYLNETLSFNHKLEENKWDLFATEGATAALIYIFNSLKTNKLLKPKDTIAIITPIFAPYLEIPLLSDYGLKTVYIHQKEEMNWDIHKEEIDKLKNPKIKALFLVNPSNPTGMPLSKNSLKAIKDLIDTSRKDLMIITDTVYAPFIDNFQCLLQEMPHNTIGVYSYSKFFGVTGFRLGVIMLHEKNIFDDLINNLPSSDKKKLMKRYSIVSPHPENIKFIEKLEMDSRALALAHTGGLASPLQAQMCLLSLFALMDKEKVYKKNLQNILKKRLSHFLEGLEQKLQCSQEYSSYYVLLDISLLAKAKYGEEFAKYLVNKKEPLEFLFKLAEEKFIVCLPGEGFAASKWSIRISLANLDDVAYFEIGKGVKETLESLYLEWKG
ncbi:MAG: bifunctional aspartate transaminase/aspartate 4-decarboxylase [Chlamydiae bacterium]|nr:bifunctional aspartate transaminase/aspartate 4-decarboxylase [Chlamydiota bacterium]